ncbi:MAG: hypothetical protein RSB86_19805, partial [Comamonas sp.]|uniref:hypothetical protein n=1 Tax=Comamonas sp. TaxID=34028 RepID=UPI002FCCB5A6
MKKLLVLTLCLLLCAPATALCDVLAHGWDAAPMEDLQEAQTALSNRISELRADKVQEEATEDP